MPGRGECGWRSCWRRTCVPVQNMALAFFGTFTFLGSGARDTAVPLRPFAVKRGLKDAEHGIMIYATGLRY